MSNTRKQPPKLGKYILRCIYDEELYNDIEGDFLEVFYERLEKEGPSIAAIKYIRDALLSVRNIDLRKRKNHTEILRTGMISSYIKMGFRVLQKNKATSIISVLGLAVALGCTITTFLWADFQSNLDSFHTKRNNIYQIISHIDEEGVRVQYGESPLLLADHLRADHPAVRLVTRIQSHSGSVRFGSQVFSENIQFVDSAFLRIFDFPMQAGDKSSLDQEQNVVLSQKMAEKYFGYDDPLGKQLSIKFPTGTVISCIVSGVLAEVPENASFKPNILLSFENYKNTIADPMNWGFMTDATFVLLQENRYPSHLQEVMETYRERINRANSRQPIEGFEFISLKHLANQSDGIYRPVAFGSSPSDYLSMAFMGILILVLACFNYLNIAISSGTRRLKEIALRKAMGSDRRDIIYQFLAENSITCGLSVLLGVLLCYFLFLPGFNYLAPVEVPFAFSSWERAIACYIGLWLCMGLLSGAYPAFYISRYQPSVIFGGKQKFSNKNYLIRSLLIFQLFLAFTTIVASFIFTDNAMFVKKLDWGYDQSNLMSIRVPDHQESESLMTTALKQQGVIRAGWSKGHVGVDNSFINFEYLDKNFRAIEYNVSPGYLQTINARLLDGRLFEVEKGLAEERSVIVNEAFTNKMGWKNPIGKRVLFDGELRNVIGVVANIRHTFFSEDDLRPMLFTSSKNHPHNFLTIRYNPESLVDVDEALRDAFHELNPDDPYDRIFQSEIFNGYYQNVDANIMLMVTIAFIAIFLSCLGLYGLMAYRVQVRIKEFGIRKVLGASKGHIVRLTAKEYIWIITIAFIPGVPLGTYGIQETVTSLFAVSKPFSILPVLIAVLITMAAIVLTVLKEILSVIHVNPAETLRD